MGRERTRAGKFIYFCAAGLIFFSLSGCSTMKKEFTRISREEPAKPASGDILRAKKLFDLGDYAGSLEETQKILSRSSNNGPRDQALFTMGLIYTHADNPQRDLEKALYSFRTVLKEYPQSPLAGEAKVLVGVLRENQRLGQMVRKFKQENEELAQVVQKFKKENQELGQVIEKFKQVDIDVEEKKREKAR